jgi:paraquat-inducible protein A
MQPTLNTTQDRSAQDRAGTDTGQLQECPDCGLFQVVPPLAPGTCAECLRCDKVLRRARRDPLRLPLVFAASGLVLYAAVIGLPFMTFAFHGRGVTTMLVTGAAALDGQGMWGLALVFLATVVLLPGLRLLALLATLVGLRQAHAPRGLAQVFRLYHLIGPWAMTEVFLLGLFVAYTRLMSLAQVSIGPAAIALGALMLATVAADASLEPEAVWDALQTRGLHAGGPVPDGPVAVGYRYCSLVSRCSGDGHESCPRCGTRLHRRKPQSLLRTWVLLLCAVILYIPANTFPVMTVVSLGRGVPNTIFSGVVELARYGMWPLAVLVFVASLTVPLLKLVGLTVMLLSVHFRWVRRLRLLTRLYRVVDVIGRWSMIDIFMLTVLTALVRLGFLASVTPGLGAVAFASVVILTMISAANFDPRLMWDAAVPAHAADAETVERGEPAWTR